MSERPTRIKPPTAKLTDANNAEPLALSSHRDSAPHTLELELRPLNPLPLLILPHQLSTMSALFRHLLINLHHQSLTPCIAGYSDGRARPESPSPARPESPSP